MIRLGIAEDHTIVRWALREALGKADDIEVVGEAGNAAETLEMIQNVRPDVLLLDLTLPDRSGFDVLNELRLKDTAPLVVVLTWHTEPSYAARAIAAGAHGYVNKAVEPEQLLAAIRAVSRGEQVIPPGVEALLAAGDGHPASALTAREQQVMEMLARGMTNREIAETPHDQHQDRRYASRSRAEEARTSEQLRAHEVRRQARLRVALTAYRRAGWTHAFFPSPRVMTARTYPVAGSARRARLLLALATSLPFSMKSIV